MLMEVPIRHSNGRRRSGLYTRMLMREEEERIEVGICQANIKGRATQEKCVTLAKPKFQRAW